MQHATTTDGALEMYPGAGIANIGIMLFRSSAKIFAEVLHTLLWQHLKSSTCGVDNSQLGGANKPLLPVVTETGLVMFSPGIKLAMADLKM